jgi:hypothetical protein
LTAGTAPRSRLALARALWGWRPHPTQREWLLDDSPVKVAACGRRWGKTEAQAVDAATFALARPGSVQVIVAPTYDQARLIGGGVERLLTASPLTRRLVRIRRTPYLQLTVTGSVVSARSADDDGRSLRGHRADRAMVDEAAFVADSVIADVVQPMLADTGGQLILISTPCGRNHFWRAWNAGQQGGGRIRSFRFPSEANPHISRDYIRHQRAELPETVFRTEYLAEFLDAASCIFAWQDVRDCAALWSRTPDPPERRVVAGVDWARYSDFTACAALDAGAFPWRVAALDRFQGLSWDAAVERTAGFVERTGAIAVLCDSTSLGDPLLEQLDRRLARSRLGAAAEGLVFTAHSKRDIIEHLCLRIARREIALPPPEDASAGALHRELLAFQREARASGSVSYSAPPGEHDDCVIALALAAWRARQLPEFQVLRGTLPDSHEDVREEAEPCAPPPGF